MSNYDSWKTATPPEYEQVDVCTCRQCGCDFELGDPREIVCGPICEIDYFFDGDDSVDFICEFVA